MMEPLKKCSFCETCWNDLEEVLKDLELKFIGYMPFPKKTDQGMFLFTHIKDKCGTTLSIKVRDFCILLGDENIKLLPFCPGAEHDCEGHCLIQNNLEQCNSKKCPGVIVRDLIQLVKKAKGMK